MTRKRGRPTKRAKDEIESPEKKVKFVDVSNQGTCDEENHEVQSATDYVNTRKKDLKQKLKIKIIHPKKTKRNVKKKKDEAEEGKDVEPEEDGASASTDSDHLLVVSKEVEPLPTVTVLVLQDSDDPWNEGESDLAMKISDGTDIQLFVEPVELENEKDESLSLLLMDLNNIPAEIPEQSNDSIVLHVNGITDDYMLLPAQSNIDLNGEDMNNSTIDNVENQDIENQDIENQYMITDNKKIQCNQDETKADSPLPEKISCEILMKAAEKLRIKKPKSTKVKSTVSFKSKSKNKHHKTKLEKTEMVPISPLIQHTVHEADGVTCEICNQKIDNDLKYDNGQPLGGFEEGTAILDARLLLQFDGDEANISTEDTRSFNKITSFSVYCKNGHLCHFDSGLIEKDLEIYFSGYVKPIHSDDPSSEDGVPGKKFGPIASWWMTGFDIGEQPTVGISTELGDYICMEPSTDYAPFMRSVMIKIYISKIVIEFLIYEPNASYEDLLAKLQTTPVPNNLMENFTEDTLLHYAPFICDQVITFDDTAKPKEQLMVTAPCIRQLISLAGIRFEVGASEHPPKGKQIFRERQFEHKIDYREKLLRQVAEDKKENSNASDLIDILLPIHEKFLTPQPYPWRCGVCERCLKSQCRECNACKNYEGCYQRRCFYREIMEENEEDVKDEMDFSDMKADDSFTLYRNAVRPLSRHTNDIVWGTKPLSRDQKRTYYGSIDVNRQLISPGDFIGVLSTNPGVPPQIMKVAYMYEDDTGPMRIHACFLWSGKYTVLGDITDRKELFFVNRCIDVDVKCIVKKVEVLERTSDIFDNSMIKDQLKYQYVCQRSYDPFTGSFHDLEPHDEEAREKYGAPYRYCWVCDANNIERAKQTPKAYNQIEEINGKTYYEAVRFKSEDYCVGSAVYLKPNKSLYFKYPMLNNQQQGPSIYSKNLDEEKYTEVYRKAKDQELNSNQDVAAPFNIGYITQIFTLNEGKIFLKVLKLYRPENTHKAEKLSMNADANVLYWSDENSIVSFGYVVGKCYLTHQGSTANIDEWSRQGPDRFYFSQIYRNSQFEDIGKGEYGCPIELCDAPLYPDAKLKTLNIFAGCGGLSLGLQQAGVAECKWAIEPDKAAAATFKLNIPKTAVFIGTCTEMMEKISKKDFKVNNHRLPKKGDVDLLCATLPSESWRSINTVDAFKSTNIATFLVYLEYYQPSFFVLEADDVLLKRSIALKLALASFIRLGYQVAFDLVQVGNFGAPQNRYRTVIFGASRGHALPDCPKNQYVFSKSSSHGCIVIDNKMYQRRNWTESAPYKATTVRDAILDLAALDFNPDKTVGKYTTQSLTFYQRMMRYDLTESDRYKVFNHVSKDLGPLVHARMSQIPIHAGSDWRDLPNVEFLLRDKTFTNKLVYSYDDPELGKGKRGQPRGVCSCSVGKRCDLNKVQEKTLIPWHLVHSGKRHGHWAGLYGKLQWNGIFIGTSTNPEPLAKKAPVIHPSKNRVLSVRECARAQGFPDSFIFAGGFPVHEMYRQIGLSTSPLLARAIGQEIAKSAAFNVS